MADLYRIVSNRFDDNKKLTIDSSLEDEKIDTLFEGFTPLYCKIKIETIEPQMK